MTRLLRRPLHLWHHLHPLHRAMTWYLLSLCGFALPLQSATPISTPVGPPVPLRSIAEIRQSALDKRRMERPVRLEGVITYHAPSTPTAFLQDSSGGMLILGLTNPAVKWLGLRVGIDGSVVEQDNQLAVQPTGMVISSPEPLPIPFPASPAQFTSGTLEGQRVTLTGIVREFRTNSGHLTLRIALRHTDFEAQLPLSGLPLRDEEWVDAGVRISGVANRPPPGTRSGLPRNQERLSQLWVATAQDVTIERPAPQDPWALPLGDYSDLVLAADQSPGPFFRARLQGIVTATTLPNTLYLRDNSGSFRVIPSSHTLVDVGDVLEVVGFPQSQGSGIEVVDAQTRLSGHGGVPSARFVNAEQARARNYENELIRLKAMLLKRISTTNQVLLWLQADNMVFDAVLPKDEATDQLEDLKEGTLLEVTGICTPSTGDRERARTFRLLLRTEEDCQILERPAFWTTSHTLVTVGIMGFLILTSILWIRTLRRQLQEQTTQICKRLEREAALESRYTDLVDNAPDLILTYDIGGRILSINRAGERFSGYSRNEVIGRHLEDLLTGGGGPSEFMPQLGRPSASSGTEVILKTKFGESIPMEARWQPLVQKGHPTEMQCIARDIRERKRAQEALQKSEEHLRLAIDAAQMGTWEYYPDTNQVVWNNWIHEQYGVLESTFGGNLQSVLEHIHPIDRAHILSTIQSTVFSGEAFQLEYRILRPDGERRWRLMQGHGLRDAHGRITRVIGVSQDVTPRKQAEQALREREEIYRAMFEKNRAVKLLIDPLTGELVDANPAAAEFYGHSLNALRRHRLQDLTVSDPVHLSGMLKEAQTGANHVIHLRQQLASGAEREVQLYPGLLTVGDRKLLFCIVLDVTEQTRATQAMTRLNEQLEQRVRERTEELQRRVAEVEELNENMNRLLADLRNAHKESATNARNLESTNHQLQSINQELEAFSYSVSHDLRAPLRHIVGYITLLKEGAGPHLTEESHRHIQTITGAARRMAELIDDLLAFSRLGRSSMSFRTVNLHDLLQEVIRELRFESSSRDVVWRVHALPNVQGDNALLRQVLHNLIENALKYTRPRTTAVIEIGSVHNQPAEGAFQVIYVKDNGVGFDMAYAEKLFGVFQRLHSLNQFEGTGIGLATVRRIINRHGGNTWAEAEPEKGATFFFSLPISQGNSPIQTAIDETHSRAI